MTETAPPTLAAPTTVRRTFARPGPRAFVRVGAAAVRATVRCNREPVGVHVGAWTPFEFDLTPHLRDQNELEVVAEDEVHPTDGFLPTLGVRWTGVRDLEILTTPTRLRPLAVQRSATRGSQLLIDGRPTRIRGILHWGWYPELAQPWPSEEQMRREIRELQSLGFNLIKFCLWIPPPRYYELCDESGMLVWQEYPIWNAPVADPALRGHFAEFFAHDGPYACVVLRSLTCENDRVDPVLGKQLVDLAHEMIPGCLVIDNSGWLFNERVGDFHDEHVYLHNAQLPFYSQRLRGKQHKPLLWGESIVASTLPDAGYEAALAMRRHQVETLARDLPDVGYVLTALRDVDNAPLGIYTRDGRLKYTPEQWAWQRDTLATPRSIPPVATQRPRGGEPATEDAPHAERHPAHAGTSQPHDARTSDPPSPIREPVRSPSSGPLPGAADSECRATCVNALADPPPIIGPRKGAWKHRDHTWWSPVVRVLVDDLPRERIEHEAQFDLLSGRVLTHTDGTRVLVELLDTHGHVPPRHLPLVIEFTSEGRRCVVSALRHDTPIGVELWRLLQSRTGHAPEIGSLVGTSLVLEHWEMSLDAERTWTRVRSDTPLVNGGANVFEGWASFRTRFEHPGGRCTLHCAAVGDYFEFFVDHRWTGEAGPRAGTWDGVRDLPREFELDLPPGEHELLFRVRDWRGGGGMVGPVYLARDLRERIF
ncbi:MAG: hypothetical protein AB7Q17_14995 [Phycisphaerae bacterium]